MIGMLLALGFALATENTEEPLLLNEATVEQFASLESVDDNMARAIVDLRVQRGGLNSVEDLRILPQIPEASLDSLRSATSVEVVLPVTSARPQFSGPEEVLARFADEPDVTDIQGWASDYARVSPESVEKWLRASRAFAGLPELKVEYRIRDGYDDGFKFYPTDGLIDTPDDDVFSVRDNAGQDRDHYITVRATWDLDKLIMSSEQIRVINEAQDVVKLREKVLGEATRIFFERRRVQVDMLLAPKDDLLGQVKDQLRLMELTANLDAVTGGRFSEALASRTPAELPAPAE